MKKNIRWLVLGYIMALCINGCDSLIGSSSEGFGTENYEQGCCSWNPIYVKIVE